MNDSISNLIDKIDDALFHNNTKIIDLLKPEVEKLEKNSEFRNYVRKTLKDNKFHKKFPYSYKKFPFSIITFLDHVGVPPEKNFLIQDIIDTFDISNKIFVKFLIKEYIIDYFPKKFIEEKVFFKEEYHSFYNLYRGF